jgi:integrase
MKEPNDKTPKKRKRGHHEGSIFQRKDGRWAATIHLGYRNGKRQRKTFYGETRAAVSKQLTVALRDHEQGLPVAVERQTVAQFLDRWLEDCAKPAVRVKTYTSYAQTARLYLKPKIGHHQLAKLAPQHLQEMMKELTEEVSAHTAAYARTVLRIALGEALKWGLVARNVASLVDPPRRQRLRVNPFTPEEAHAFLQAIKGDRLEALFSVPLAMGLRQGEALGLRWTDIDFEARLLKLERQLQRENGKLTLTELKSESSRRTLPLPETVVTALRAHRIRQLEEKMLAGKRWQENGLVFTSTVGTPLDARNLLRKYHAARERAGLRHQRYHDLRHCAGSLLLAQGVPPKTISEILGHSDIRLTLNTYAHVMPVMKREAADLMDAILSGQK